MYVLVNYAWILSLIFSDPKMFVVGVDVTQGILDNHWLLGAMASLCSNKGILSQVIPFNQEWGAGLVTLLLLIFNEAILFITVMLGYSTFVFGILVTGLMCVSMIDCQLIITNWYFPTLSSAMSFGQHCWRRLMQS